MLKQPSHDELKALKPKNLVEFRNNNPEMGTISIRANQTKLNSSQVYRIYKQRQAIEQFFLNLWRYARL